MAHFRKIVWVLVLALAMNLTLAAYAADDSAGIWMNAETDGDEVVVTICANTQVSSGLIRLSFDATKMTYNQLQIDTDLVAVNAEEAGVVQISWIATQEAAESDSYVLMQVKFTGTLPEDLTLSGAVYTPDGQTIRVTNLDFTALEEAIAQAAGLKKDDYTAESFAALEKALAEAQAALEDVTVTQKDVDAVLQKLQSALAGLEKAPEQQPTQDPTQDPTGDQDDQEPKKDLTVLWIVLGVVAVAAVAVVVIVIVKKKGAAK